jgi:hypothetical protein
MRTTIRIDDDLMSDLRRRAAAERASLSSLVNRLLRLGLRALGEQRPKRKFRQKTFRMGEPIVDLTKSLRIAALLEDEETARKMVLRK